MNTVKSYASHDWQLILDRVQETRLANGLRLLVMPKRGTGSVVCDIYYGGGSSSDPAGRFGLSHYLEHMLFNGTKRVPHGYLDRLILQIAGQHNAETGPDYTHFWCQVPKHGLELALALEADRMTGACLAQADVDRERPVILEEEARYREQPFDELMTQLMAKIYDGHPYAHPTIGTPADLARITRMDLESHYRRMFQPSNAVLVVTGDASPKMVVRLVEKHFSKIVAQPDLEKIEPVPSPSVKTFNGTRIMMNAEEVVPRGAMIWPAPGPFELAARPWGVTASILGNGRASRLWQALVEQSQVAAFVNVSLSEERHGGYLMVELELNSDSDPYHVENMVHQTFNELARNGPTESEIKRVARQRSAVARWARQQAVTLAGSLGTWSLFSDWHLLAEAWRIDDLVTAADVQAVAGQLGRQNMVVGWTIPQNAEPSSEVANQADDQQRTPRDEADNLPAREDAQMTDKRMSALVKRTLQQPSVYRRRTRPVVRQTPEGMTMLVESLSDEGICALELRWRSGWLQEELPGIAWMTSRMCEETIHPASEMPMGEWFESNGVTLETSPSSMNIQGRIEDLDDILAGIYRLVAEPLWTPEMFERVLRRTRTDLEADLDDPSYHADLLLRRLVYDGGPGSEDARGTVESLKAMTLEQILRHHHSYYRPENALMGLSGDFTARSLMSRWTKTYLKKWRQRSKAFPAVQLQELFGVDDPLPSGRVVRMKSPGVQSHVVMGHRTVPRTHPDWIALQILEIIVGAGPGMTDIMNRRLRDELGLVYGVNLSMADGAWRTPGYMRVGFSCDPTDARRAGQETITILRRVAAGQISDSDCDEARNYLANSWNLGMEPADDRLSTWMDAELHDWDLNLPPVWIRDCIALTNDEIRAAATRWIRPDKLQVVRFGPK